MMDCYWCEYDIPNTAHALRLARWHIREKEIAVLEARISDRKALFTRPFDIQNDSVLNNLQSRLAELRKEKV